MTQKKRSQASVAKWSFHSYLFKGIVWQYGENGKVLAEKSDTVMHPGISTLQQPHTCTQRTEQNVLSNAGTCAESLLPIL